MIRVYSLWGIPVMTPAPSPLSLSQPQAPLCSIRRNMVSESRNICKQKIIRTTCNSYSNDKAYTILKHKKNTTKSVCMSSLGNQNGRSHTQTIRGNSLYHSFILCIDISTTDLFVNTLFCFPWLSNCDNLVYNTLSKAFVQLLKCPLLSSLFCFWGPFYSR